LEFGNVTINSIQVGNSLERYLLKVIQAHLQHVDKDSFVHKALVFIIDAHDTSSGERITEAQVSLERARNGVTGLGTLPLLILLNKQDLLQNKHGDQFSTTECIDALKLHELNVPYHVQLCSALTLEGVKEGFDWLAHALVAQNQQQQQQQVKK